MATITTTTPKTFEEMFSEDERLLTLLMQLIPGGLLQMLYMSASEFSELPGVGKATTQLSVQILEMHGQKFRGEVQTFSARTDELFGSIQQAPIELLHLLPVVGTPNVVVYDKMFGIDALPSVGIKLFGDLRDYSRQQLRDMIDAQYSKHILEAGRVFLTALDPRLVALKLLEPAMAA